MTDEFDLGEVEFVSVSGKNAGEVPCFKSPNTTIRAFNYPLCCTGAVIACFGGSDDGYIYHGDSPDDLKEQISAWIKFIRSYDGGFPQRKEFICASTTTEQNKANDALKELGFERSKLMTNNVNTYPIYTWVLALSGYEEEE
tara:strand:+ start:27893 stop:28318 length:426 start_codon:yes stop_codon:yes gene_type:complete